MSADQNRYTIPRLLLRPEGKMRRKGTQNGSYRITSEAWYVRYKKMVRTEAGNVEWRETEKKIRDVKGREERAFTDDKRVPTDVLTAGAALVADANKLKARPSGLLTFGEFAESRYIPDRMERLNTATQRQYGTILRCHILPTLGNLQLAEIVESPSIVHELIAAKAAKFSRSTVGHIRKIIGLVFRYARQMQAVSGALPTEDVRIDGKAAKQQLTLSLSDVRLITTQLPAQTARLIWTLWHTGMRIGEVCGLRWDAINFTDEPSRAESGEWVMPNSLLIFRSFSSGEWKGPKTRAGIRHFPLTEELREVLLSQLAQTKCTGRIEPVFPGARGGPSIPNHLGDHIRPALKRIGFEWVHFHTFRHSWATRYDATLTRPEKIALIGHTNANMTDRYTHPDATMLAEKLSQLSRGELGEAQRGRQEKGVQLEQIQ